MKKLGLIIIAVLSFTFSNAQTTIITDDSTYTPTSTNAILEVHSANGNKGILVPRLTTAQRTAISTSAANDKSLLVFDTDTNTFWYFDGTQWVEIIPGGTDDQLLTLSNDTLYIENGNWVYLGDYKELPQSAVSGQVLTWNGTAWVAQNPGSGADNWGSQVVISDASLNGDGTSGNPLTVNGTLTDDQNISGSGLSGTTLTIGIENGSNETVDLSSLLGTDDQNISGSGLSGTTLTIGIENGSNETVDLSSLLGTDDQNLTGASLSGNTLQIDIENGASTTVDLSQFMDNTDNQTLSLSGNNLSILNGNTVDLSSFMDNTDNQNLSLSGTTINITNGTGVDISSAITSTAWSLTGNSGTTAGTNFIGTTDSKDFVVKTNNTERYRVTSGGRIGIGTTNPQFNMDLHSTLGITDGTSFVILNGTRMRFNENDDYQIGSGTGYSGIGSFGAIITIGGTSHNVGIGTTSPGYPLTVASATANVTGAFFNTEASVDNYAVYGDATTTDGYGYGGVFVGGHIGVRSSVTATGSGSYFGVYSDASGGTGNNYGVYGKSDGNDGFGVEAYNSNTSGTGLMAIGNGAIGSYLTTGTGLAATGTDGVYGKSSDATGTGIIGAGNNGSSTSLTSGSGVAGTGSTIGVAGFSTNAGNDVWGGYFEASGNSQYAYVGGQFSGTNYKINGSGSVSTIVKRTDGTRANMFCPEAPEILFQDYGQAQLVNGRAHIDLDPILTKNIVVNSKHPLRVFIQLEGDCKGVYVTNKTQNGFDVIELQGGTSNVSFSWSITANRADEFDDNGNRISKNADIRFPDGPGPRKSSNKEVKKVKKIENLDKPSIKQK